MKRKMRVLAALTLAGFLSATANVAIAAPSGGFGQIAGGGAGRGGDSRDWHDGRDGRDGDRRGDHRHGGNGWKDRDHDGRHERWERHGHAPRYYVPVRAWHGGGGRGRTVVVNHRNDGLIFIGSALVGGLIGYAIGHSSNHPDDRNASSALETNRTGERSTWVNPDNNAQVSVTPVRTYQNSSEEYCREYTTEVRVGGQTQSAYGTACRQPDGSWKIVE